MDNEQKQFTLEDVRKITLEEFRELSPEQKAVFTQEQKDEIKTKMARRRRIESGDFITNQDFQNFMHGNGYNIVGYDSNSYDFDNSNIRFSRFNISDNDYRYTSRRLILLGPESEWGESIKDFRCKNIVKNPFVKYIVWNLTEFKMYTIVGDNSNVGFGGGYDPSFAAKLEKDLSNEWVKYWALKDEEYREFILAECKQVKREVPESIERHNNLLAKRIAELQENTTKVIAEENEKLERYNKMEQIVKNAKVDLQV